MVGCAFGEFIHERALEHIGHEFGTRLRTMNVVGLADAKQHTTISLLDDRTIAYRDAR